MYFGSCGSYQIPELQAGQEKFTSDEKFIQIIIQDNGIGITRDWLPYVFDRFYQADHSPVRKSVGSGIGLALTKELTELHGGKISVQSEIGKGTLFTVLLPFIEKADNLLPEPIQFLEEKNNAYLLAQEISLSLETIPVLAAKENAPILLIVEDNVELRQLIKRSFKHYYRIEEAADGTKAWKKAVRKLPDLIISDVMMPGQDGFSLCKQLKNDARTSHIPVILLTARTDAEEEGLQLGADDYIIKPFNPKALILKVKNLFEARQKLRKAICEEIGASNQAESSKISSIHAEDRKFLENITGIIHNHLTDTKFELETLYRELEMGRNLVYKKLKALTGLSPNEFIRHLRLTMAAKLLAEERLPLPELMARVGFNHRSYFVKCFREQFGFSPTEFGSSQEYSTAAVINP